MAGHRFDGPVLLDERRFGTGEVVRLSGVAEKQIANWHARDVLRLGELHFTKRRVYSLLDAIQFAVMADLTQRVPLKPSDAKAAAEYLARYVVEQAPRDAGGRPIADPNAIPRSFAFGLYAVDGVMCVEEVDSTRPGAHVMAQVRWGRAHILLPVAALVGDVIYRLLELVHAHTPEPVA